MKKNIKKNLLNTDILYKNIYNKYLFKAVKAILVLIVIFIALYWIVGDKYLASDGFKNSFRCEEFNTKWTWIVDGKEAEEITFPIKLDVNRDENVVFKTTLPEKIYNDDCLCIKSSKQDMKIYIDGKLRKEYTTKDTRAFGKISAGAYVFVPLLPEDAGKTIVMESSTDSTYTGIYLPMFIGNEIGIWYHFADDAKIEVIVALIMAILGLITAIGGLLLNVIWKKKTEIHFLGTGILLAAIWIITNSPVRQILFENISIANDIAFSTVMILPIPFVLYMNSLQGERYRVLYLWECVISIVQFVILSFLHDEKIIDFTDTVSYMTGTAFFIILSMGITVAWDVKKKRIKEYSLVIVGIVGACISACIEMTLYFIKSVMFTGVVLAIGLVFLLVMAVISTVMNILNTERKKQEAEYASEAKARFLANMSHEIRTPINAVLGMNEMILRESNEPNVREYAYDIQGASQNLLSLINDILDFSKIESGRMELIEASYGVSSMINDISNMIKIKAEDKGLDLKLSVDKNMPSILYGDEVRIRQVLINILNNAVKYTKKGSVHFSIGDLKFENREDGKYVDVEFSVEDTGIGIKKEDVGKLFTEFERIEENKNRNIEGTGLGMSITVQLLNLMGSKLLVESEYGKGSKFYFRLTQKVINSKPIGDIEGNMRKQNNNNKYRAPFFAKEANVLVVDDNAVNRKVFRNLLKQTGIKIEECENGYECLKMIKEKYFDIIFLDHMMPEMDGMETLYQMKNDTNHKCNESYVVALTANAISGAKQKYLDAGFDNYLSKPIDVKQLEKLIQNALPENLISYEKDETQDNSSMSNIKNGADNIYDVDNTSNGNQDKESILPDISEIDWTYAKIHINDEKLLLDTMREFFNSMESEKNYLRSRYEEIFMDPENVNEESLNLYRIKVHAMKSSSALLGMNGLSGVAKILEFAARDNKISVIKNVTLPFLEEWDRFFEILGEYFKKEEVNEEQKEEMDYSVVIAYLEMLRMAILEMDVDKADEIIENLRKIRFEEDVIVEFKKLETFVMNLDSKSVISCADRIEQLLCSHKNS